MTTSLQALIDRYNEVMAMWGEPDADFEKVGALTKKGDRDDAGGSRAVAGQLQLVAVQAAGVDGRGIWG